MIFYLCIFGLIFLIITFKLRGLNGKTSKDFYNEILNSSMWFFGALIFPFAYSTDISTDVYNYFNIFTDIAMIGIFVVVIVIVGRQKLLVKKKPTLISERTYERFSSSFRTEYTLRMDIERKTYHALIPVFVLFAYILGNFIVSFLGLDFVSGHDLGIFLIINCGFGGLFLFAIADIMRMSVFFSEKGISVFHLLPSTVLDILTKRMHKHELVTFVPTVAILLSFIPFLPAPFAVFSSVTLIASISDAMASIFGKAFFKKYPGKWVYPGRRYKFYKGKNLIGYIAGFISTILICIVMFSIFPVEGIDVIEIIILAIIVALIFLLIDISSPPVNDNVLNPLACGLSMILCLLFL